VCLYYQTGESKQWCSTVLTCVKILHSLFQHRLNQKSTDHAAEILLHTAFDLAYKNRCYSFIEFQDHVAGKCFTDDNICLSVRDFSRFDASDKVNILTFFQHRKSLLDQGITLFFLSSDIDDRNLRILDSHNMFHIDRTHLGKLHQM